MKTRWITLSAVAVVMTATVFAHAGYQWHPPATSTSEGGTVRQVSAWVDGIRRSADPYSYVRCTTSGSGSSCRIRDENRVSHYCYLSDLELPPVTPYAHVRIDINKVTGKCSNIHINTDTLQMEPL